MVDMSNPVLTEKVFAREAAASSASGFAPRTGTPASEAAAASGAFSTWAPPPAGTVIDEDVMRVGGVASATGILLAVCFIAAFFGWQAVHIETARNIAGETVVVATKIPGWLWPAWIIGFVLAIVTVMKPAIARVTGVLYVIAQGLAMGAISKIFDAQYNGIVAQALFLTGAVFVIMLGLFTTGAIKVTDKLRTGIIVATVAVLAVYLISWIVSFFGVRNPAVFDAGPIGILFSLVVVGIAAMNLLLDFDFVQRAVAARAPRHMEWYAAFGLMVTLIWLYLEILRLLAKLRE